MRNASQCLGIVLLLAAATGRSIAAQSTSQTGGTLNCAVTVVVHSFFRVVTTAADPSTGLPPTTRVVTNDPALRAAYAAGVRPEVVTPEAIATLRPDRVGGGAEAWGNGELAGPVTVRYTVVNP